MEIDTLLDITGESMCCVGMVLEGAILFLGTRKGRFILFGTKLLGLILDIVALKSANSAVDIGFGIQVSSGLFESILIIFLFERICVFGFIWKYGLHPNNQYQKYALKEIQQQGADHDTTNNEQGSVVVNVEKTTITTPSSTIQNDINVFNQEWLNNNIGNDYGEYYNLFIQSGYEDFETICTLDDQGLIDVGIIKKGHRVKLLLRFDQIRQENICEKMKEDPVKDGNDDKSGKTNTIETGNNQINNKKDISSSSSELGIIDHINLIFNQCDNNKLEGIKSLWYGSLWNTSDYIAQIYKYQPLKQVKCIMIWYIFSIIFLLILSIVYIFSTMQQFSLESFSNTSSDFESSVNSGWGSSGWASSGWGWSDSNQQASDTNNDNDNSESNDLQFSTFDAFMMFISMSSVQLGLVQHVMAFGSLYNQKREDQNDGNPSKYGKCIKKGSFICAIIIFVVMIMLIVVVIQTLQTLADWDNDTF